MEPQFELKLSVLGQKVKVYPTKCVGDLNWTPMAMGTINFAQLLGNNQ